MTCFQSCLDFPEQMDCELKTPFSPKLLGVFIPATETKPEQQCPDLSYKDEYKLKFLKQIASSSPLVNLKSTSYLRMWRLVQN